MKSYLGIFKYIWRFYLVTLSANWGTTTATKSYKFDRSSASVGESTRHERRTFDDGSDFLFPEKKVPKSYLKNEDHLWKENKANILRLFCIPHWPPTWHRPTFAPMYSPLTGKRHWIYPIAVLHPCATKKFSGQIYR